MERQHVLIPDGIDDGVGMQRFRRLAVLVRLTAEELGGCRVFATRIGVDGEDGCTCESEHHVFLHPFGDEFVHVAKLRTVALVEYQHDIFLRQHLAQFLVLIPRLGLHQVRQFLDGGDDDVHRVILQLLP